MGSCSIYASSVQACSCFAHQQACRTWLSSSSYSKHSNTKMIRAHSKFEPFLKPNSKRCETGTQPRSIRDQNDSSIGSKLEPPFMKLNSKRSETESGTQPRSIRDRNDPSIVSKLEPGEKRLNFAPKRPLWEHNAKR